MERGYKLKDRPEYKSKPQPITFRKTDTVAKAVKVMSERNYGSVVIVDNQNKDEYLNSKKINIEQFVVTK